MKRASLPAAILGFLVAAGPALADPGMAAGVMNGAGPAGLMDVPKALNAQTLGARGTVTPSVTLSGGFEIRQQGDVYIVVRGNSLGTLGITQNFLDAPRVRLFNQQGQDLVTDGSGNVGFNACVSGSTFGGPVVSFYQNVRNTPVHLRDSCLAVNLPVGVYTFGVNPSPASGANSVPSSGEVLFEVTLNP
jgi:hypothetical protein